VRELRDAIRQWVRTPVITIVVVASLALGIGANTAIFSLIDSLLLKPLPVDHAARLVRVHNPRFNNHSIPTFEQLRDGSPVFDAVTAMSLMRPDVSSTTERRSAQGIAVSGSFFDVLGVHAANGRLLGADDDRRGLSEPVAVLEYHYWQSAFGGRADVLGKTIPLDGKPFTIVGVTEQGFFGPSVGRRFDVAVSLAGYLHLYPDAYRVSANSIWIIGRLRNDQPLAAAQAELRVRQPQIRAALGVPDTLAQLNQPWELVSMQLGAVTATQDRYAAPLRVLMALVALVLIIACVNVANLMLAKAAARQGELAVRLSLGATRTQILRSLILESLVIAFAGAAGGVLVGIWTARAIVDAISVGQGRLLSAAWIEVMLDWRMLGFTAGVGIVTAVIFGIGPALRSTRVDPLQMLRQRTRGTVGGGTRFGVSQALVAAQVAIAFVLVIGGGLLMRSFVSMTTQDLGFDADHITVAVPDFSRSRIRRQERIPTAQRLRAQLRATPGIEEVALVESTPFGLGEGVVQFTVPGTDNQTTVVLNRVGDGLFRMLGMAITAGRDFVEIERETPTAAVVNEAFAARYLAGLDPMGQTLRLGVVGRPQVNIVGVVANAKSGSLRDAPLPTVYVPFRLNDEPWIEINIRSRIGETAVKQAVLEAAAQLAPGAGVEFRSIDLGIRNAAAGDRLVAWLAGGFAVLALLLSAIGLYGVMSHQVIRRRQEFGVRVAIGAAPASVTALILRQTSMIVAAGLLAGLAGAMASGRLLEALLFEVSPSDPVVIAAAGAFLAMVTLLAGFIPARRAARIDPMVALREE
jgi:putative ABC transport system permease protein